MKQIYTTLKICLLLLSTVVVHAQQAYQTAIQSFLEQNRVELGLTNQDIQEWIVASDAPFNGLDIMAVYIQQKHNGIDIFNGTATFSIRNNEVLSMGNRLVSNLATKANASNPLLMPADAIDRAAQSLGLSPTSAFQMISAQNSQEFLYTTGGIASEDIPVKLVYQPIEDGNQLRLAWDLRIYSNDLQNWWSMRVDAVDGQILEVHDWVLKCSFGECSHPRHQNNFDRNSSTAFHALQSAAPATLMATPATDRYNVFPMPVESPNHGSRSVVVGPADLVASPFGWHDTNGANGEEFTTTRGNNVLAQDDQNGNNGTGATANGGAALNFDFPLNLNQAPAGYLDAALTNLFFWNNITHDVWYRYGFDEASGNFQSNNYGRGGTAGDYVLADCQDGSGLNNANFSTPVDGGLPRMQMFLWSAPTSSPIDKLTINAPGSLARGYNAVPAGFGGAIPTTPLTRDLVMVVDNTAPTDDACEAITNAAALNGKIAVIRRGACSFVIKVKAAQNAGAVGVVMVNNAAGSPITMGGTDATITIPSVMISDVDGNPIIAALNAGQTVNGTLVDQPVNGFQLDGDLDNGIIAHEYGHGISIRLAGGRTNSSCLNNADQMGEGWSDWYGLMMTIEPGDNGAMPRGIGTYAIGESPSGGGIRPMPYSTNFSVNNATYALTNNTATITAPHGIGFVWCTMLWDLTWAFIGRYGYDPNIYTGTGGNNKIMQLVLDGLKLQPCSPGSVDGRNAILQADQNRNGGANECLIWQTFAARGLGFSASQGTTSNRTNQVEAFDMPPTLVCTALPIELSSYEAKVVDDKAVLNSWTTATEFNNAYFIVERSKNAVNFETVGTVMSNGDSPSAQSYEFVDANPLSGTSYYRLRQINKDGSFSVSRMIAVNFANNDNGFVQVAPNPNRGIFNLIMDLGTTQSETVMVRVIDMMGRVVLENEFIQTEGMHTYSFDISNYAAGAYILTVHTGDGSWSTTKRFVKED